MVARGEAAGGANAERHVLPSAPTAFCALADSFMLAASPSALRTHTCESVSAPTFIAVQIVAFYCNSPSRNNRCKSHADDREAGKIRSVSMWYHFTAASLIRAPVPRRDDRWAANPIAPVLNGFLVRFRTERSKMRLRVPRLGGCKLAGYRARVQIPGLCARLPRCYQFVRIDLGGPSRVC